MKNNHDNFTNGTNNSNFNHGGITMTNGTLTTMDAFVSTVRAAMEAVYADGYSVTVQKVWKNNGITLTGLVIKEDGMNIAPTIYLDGFYGQYRAGRTLADIISEIRSIYEDNRVRTGFDVSMVTDYSVALDRICFKLVNAEKNRGLLGDIPYIAIHDLAIVFFLDVSDIAGETAAITVHNGMMAQWGEPDVQDLFKIAKANTQRKFKGRVAGMMEIMGEVIAEQADNVDPDMADAFFDMDVYEDSTMPMFIATNRRKFNGAAVIFYDGLLKGFADKIGGDFYILPSSIHETIFLPANDGVDIGYLIQMVREINATQVAANEVLSDNVYLYRADTDSMEMMQ